MKVAICDDDVFSSEILNIYIKETRQIRNSSIFNEPECLLKQIRRGEYFDLVFMDIDFGKDENGIDFANMIFQISPDTQIVFVTGYNNKFFQYIFLKQVNLCGYLTKPISYEIYSKIVEKAFANKGKRKDQNFCFKIRGKVHSIPYSRICYVESSGHQVIIHTYYNEEIRCIDKLERVKKTLPYNFVQCHKSFIVNMDYIRRIEQKQIILMDESIIPISKAKYSEAKSIFFCYAGDKM